MVGETHVAERPPAQPAAVRPARRRRFPALLKTWLDPLGLLGLAGLLALWYAVAAELGPVRLPNPDETVTAMLENFTSSPVMASQGLGDNGISGQLGITIFRTVAGVTIGGVLGIAIGVLMASSQRIQLLLRPPLETLRLTPSLVAAPFLVLWFGTSAWAQMGLVAFYSLITLQLSAYAAVKNLPPYYARYSRTLGATPRQVMRTVTLPGIVPELVGAFRVVLQLGWGLELVAELIGAQRGIGRMMSSMQSIFRTDLVVAGIIAIAIAAVITDWAVKLLMYRATQWSDEYTAGESWR